MIIDLGGGMPLYLQGSSRFIPNENRRVRSNKLGDKPLTAFAEHRFGYGSSLRCKAQDVCLSLFLQYYRPRYLTHLRFTA